MMVKALSSIYKYQNRFTGELERLRGPDSVRIDIDDIDCQAARDGMTEQHHEADCNINNIVKRCTRDDFMLLLRNGILAFQGMVFGDMEASPTDYQSSLNFVNTIDMKFASLPAEVRAAYDNDAGKFMDSVKKDPRGVFAHGQAIIAGTLPEGGPKVTVTAPETVSKEAPSEKEKK